MLDGEDLLHRDTAIRTRHAQLFEIGRRLLQFGLVLLPAGSIKYTGASPDIVTSAVLALFTIATKTFRGIHHLSGNVLTEPAIMLLRSLLECWASLGFIVADPAKRAERAHWYLTGEAVENYQWGKKLREANLIELIPQKVLQNPEGVLEDARKHLVEREAIERGQAGAEERAAAMLKRMRKGQWGGVTTEQMYKIAEQWANGSGDVEVAAYATIFKFASGVLHGRKPDMFMRMTEDGTVYPNLQADPTYLAYALFISNLLYISVLQAINEVFSLPRGASIQSFREELRTAGAASKAEDSSA